MLATDHIVIVDENDLEIGVGEKLLVHLHGIQHRAFSVFVINAKGQLLLQRRAMDKYHSAGLWTNTCCSHALPNTDIETVVHERIQAEMGFDCPIQWLFKFSYKVGFENGLIENEIDHVYLGFYDGNPLPEPSEVCEWKWLSFAEIVNEIEQKPEDFTYWFRHVFQTFVSEYNKLNNLALLDISND